jgi:type III pantothenate kinase
MFLVIDAGNTSTSFAFFDIEKNKDTLKYVFKIKTKLLINNKADLSCLPIENISVDKILIGSVAPKVNDVLKKICKSLYKINPLFVKDDNVKLPILINEDNPKITGADRIANAIAGFAVFNQSCVVIDMGTATTFDYVDSKGNLSGSSFVPGIEISLEALISKAALLPKITIEKPKKIIATNSIDAMRSGVFYGYLSLMEGLALRIKEEKRRLENYRNRRACQILRRALKSY